MILRRSASRRRQHSLEESVCFRICLFQTILLYYATELSLLRIRILYLYRIVICIDNWQRRSHLAFGDFESCIAQSSRIMNQLTLRGFYAATRDMATAFRLRAYVFLPRPDSMPSVSNTHAIPFQSLMPPPWSFNMKKNHIEYSIYNLVCASVCAEKAEKAEKEWEKDCLEIYWDGRWFGLAFFQNLWPCTIAHTAPYCLRLQGNLRLVDSLICSEHKRVELNI